MVLFRIFFLLATAVALVVLLFLLLGLGDGSVSGFNAGLWLLLVAFAAGVPAGGLFLRRRGKPWLANALLLVPALPGLLAGMVMLWLVIAQPTFHP